MVALCLFFSTVTGVVEGQRVRGRVRGASTKSRQLQDGEQVTTAAMGGGGHMEQMSQVPKATHHSYHSAKSVQTHHSAKSVQTHHSHHSAKSVHTKNPRTPNQGPTTGDVTVEEAIVFVVDSNTTAVDDDEEEADEGDADAVVIVVVASNTTADDDDVEEGEGEVRY